MNRLSKAGEVRASGQTDTISMSYSMYLRNKDFFAVDPSNVFTMTGKYLMQARLFDNCFAVYNIDTLSRLCVVSYHKAVVNVVCACEEGDKLYTGDVDGVVACWSINGLIKSADSIQWPIVISAINI